MVDGVTVNIHGLADLERKMIQLGPKLAKSALRAALVAGAAEIKKEAQALAPVKTGRISKKAIYIARVPEAHTSSSEEYVVSVRHGRKEHQRDRDAFYWKFLEFGTKFIAARPFLRPAFESKKYAAFQRIRKKLFERLEILAR